MKTKFTFITILVVFLAASISAQRPPRPQGPPGAPEAGGPPPGGPGGPPPMGQQGPGRPGGPPMGDWLKQVDTNQNGTLEADEFQAAIDRTFAALDKNGNGTIEAGEPAPPQRPSAGQRPSNDGNGLLPPFFFDELLRGGQAVTREQFNEKAHAVFKDMDKNGDGVISRDEARRQPHPPRPDGPQPLDGGRPPMPPNAEFIGAEMRFGDALVTGQPFSADTVIQDTRRLYDGSTVTKENRGVVYRDTAGRTRREEQLGMVGDTNVVGSDGQPQKLVFINDIAGKTQIFLDENNKTAHRNHVGENRPPMAAAPDGPPDAKTESLGTKTMEGVTVEGTRTTFEVPAGELGNDKPIQVVTEKWFSPELQVVVMMRHVDPIAGEHVFKLVNIKRGEPSADLFTVPADYRVENPPARRPQE